jgi:DNA-binding NarL/FixJ family response regulator
VNILIVEDNRHMRRVLREMLRSAFESIQLAEATNAADALTACRDGKPDVVLMDVGLPDASGIELTAQIKALLPSSVVLIVSNHRSRMDQDAARVAGAAAYIFKDDVYENLLPALALVLSQPR